MEEPRPLRRTDYGFQGPRCIALKMGEGMLAGPLNQEDAGIEPAAPPDGAAFTCVEPAAPDADSRERPPSLLTPEPAPVKQPRLVSLDAFRGLTIFGMLLVNNMALDTATPRELTHAGWNQGVHVA